MTLTKRGLTPIQQLFHGNVEFAQRRSIAQDGCEFERGADPEMHIRRARQRAKGGVRTKKSDPDRGWPYRVILSSHSIVDASTEIGLLAVRHSVPSACTET